MKHIDLHVHTTASDGTLTPSEAVFHAKALGLSAIAVTDHDTHEGVGEAMEAGAAAGVEVVPGIELSVEYRGYGVHILGYLYDPDAPAMAELLNWVTAERRRRNRRIAEAMCADGIPVDFDALEARYPGAVIGRPHFAAALAELGLAESVKDGFTRYLNRGQKYFRSREYIPLQQAFDVLHAAGGRAVMAHPLQYRLTESELRTLVRRLTDAGAVGLECLYTGDVPAQTEYLSALAADFGLCITGGSDFHGCRKPNEMGTPAVPYALLEELKQR